MKTRASRRASQFSTQATGLMQRVLRSFLMRERAVLAFLLSVVPGFAWGPEGHRLVARIAEDLLTPAAAARAGEGSEGFAGIGRTASGADCSRLAAGSTAVE